jgi:hypothetical protein
VSADRLGNFLTAGSLTDSQAQTTCQVSDQMLRWRLRMTGVGYQLSNARKRLASGLILTFASLFASSESANVKILKSTRINLLLVVLEILTFAAVQATEGCKCLNRTTSG